MRIYTVLFTLSLGLSAPLLAGGSGEGEGQPLSGTYPVVLAHGILGFDDTDGMAGGLVKYWGGMDDYLRSQGTPVLTPGKTAMAGLEQRAIEQRDQINYWMAANGYPKVHMIGHSQGGLDSRYMIANLGMSGKVASLTTLNSVHRGTPVADVGLGVIPDWLEPYVAEVLNAFGRLVYGGGDQDVIDMTLSLTTGAMAAFNEATPDVSIVKYYSYGSKMTFADPLQHPLMAALYPVTYLGGAFNGQGGENDGVVPLSSQSWGVWKGGPDYGFHVTGIDHLQATNFEWSGQVWYDVEGYYSRMVANARDGQGGVGDLFVDDFDGGFGHWDTSILNRVSMWKNGSAGGDAYMGAKPYRTRIKSTLYWNAFSPAFNIPEEATTVTLRLTHKFRPLQYSSSEAGYDYATVYALPESMSLGTKVERFTDETGKIVSEIDLSQFIGEKNFRLKLSMKKGRKETEVRHQGWAIYKVEVIAE